MCILISITIYSKKKKLFIGSALITNIKMLLITLFFLTTNWEGGLIFEFFQAMPLRNNGLGNLCAYFFKFDILKQFI